MDWIERELAEIEKAHLKRSLRTTGSESGVMIEFEGKRVLNFSSNDYLGLASENFLKEEACRAAQEWGTGSGSARLICGNLKIHQALEEATAALKGTEAALTFSSGYAVPLGVIPAVLRKGETVILDKLCHACLIDGAKLSGAKIRVYPHQNLNRLEEILRETLGNKTIVTESVFSMDGDLTKLREIVELKEKYGASLLVDEAHATGIYGDRGGGRIESLGLSDRVEIQMGTYSKALGSSGGYVAGSRKFIDFLHQKARSFIYSTGNSPITAAVSLASVRWIQSPSGLIRRKKLQNNIGYFRDQIALANSSQVFLDHRSPIFPWMIGEEQAAMIASKNLLDRGFLTVAIRYPTVPRQKGRLRISLSASHTEQQMDRLIVGLKAGLFVLRS